jgi:pyruvate dehydrogenase E2 component (dihydrolipoyllysine-residue acetyltransferase)
MDFPVPKLSATMETVKVLRWLKQVGDKVAMGEPLVELETDKAAMEVESPAEGTLEEILGAEGEELSVGAILARIRTASESASPSKTTLATAAMAPPSSHEADFAAAASRSSAETTGSRILASPFAKRLAKMNGTDLSAFAARNPLRRIRGRDVIAALETRDAKAKLTTPASAGFEPLSSARRQIAESVTLSRRTIPSFVIDRWVETTAIDRARMTLDREIETAVGVKPTFTDFLLEALAQSFAMHPRILDRWHEANGGAGRIGGSSFDVGLVVALADGVMIPVLRNLADKSLREITQARRDAIQRARSGRLQQADNAPVSFSVSNLGRSGADRFEAIIYPGQSAILAVGRQHERVIARAGGVAVANGVNLTLSLDHRLIDGLLGAQFIDTLAERVERGPRSG